MNRILALFKRGRIYIENSIRRFPEAILAATIMVILGIYVNHTNNYEDEIGKVVLSLLLGLPWWVSLVLVKERLKWENKKRSLISLGIAVICIVFYTLLPEDLDQLFFIRYMAATLIGFMTFAIVSHVFEKKLFSRYVLYIFASFFTTYFFTIVLYLGLSGLVFAIESLFDLSIDGDVYVDMFMIAIGIFGVSYFLGMLPEEEDFLEKYEPKVFRLLFSVVVIPLIWAYTAVLYAYLVRIVIQFEWPEGIVGHLVLWYGLVVMIAQFAIKDMRDKQKHVQFFEDFYAYFFIIPLVMMFVTIIIRINAYGITLLRFLFVTFAVFYAFNTVYRIFIKKNANMVLVLSAIVLTILSIFGPMNAINISFSSQNNRLEAALKSYDLLIDGDLIANENLSDEGKDEINSIVRFFDNLDSVDEIRVFPEDFDVGDMKAVLGFDYRYRYYYADYDYFNFNSNIQTFYSIADYDYMVIVSRKWDSEEDEVRPYDVDYDTDEQMIMVYQNGDLHFEESLDVFFEGYEKYFKNDYMDHEEPLKINRYLDDVNLFFEFHNVGGDMENEKRHFDYLDGYLWIQEK